MTATAEARWVTVPITNHRQRKRLSRSARDRINPLYQAVCAPFSVKERVNTTFPDCIKDGSFIDPPYTTGNDFVYEDDFADPLAWYREVTQQTTKCNPESMGRFHTNWLNMMYPRLRLAANLLRDDGVIFISLNDNEIFSLKKLCDEVFGEENFVANLIWQSKYTVSNDDKYISYQHENILFYSKSIAQFEIRG